nr:sulfotransferase [Qipengyuania xiamenensis]
MALAQHNDRKGDAEQAWNYAVTGNRLSPSGARRDWRRLLDAQLSIYRDTAAVEQAQERPRHFYLCGAPRSGQSLVQSILAASPAVTSVGERGALLPHLLDPSQKLAAMPRAERERFFSQLSEADRRGFARLAASSCWIVDKNPVQLVVAGALARIHPGAVFAVNFRDPADVAVSIFLRGFSPFYDYATDLGAIIDHLELIADAVAAWRDEGLEIRALSHEALVADPAGQSQGLFDWLGLEWNQDYLDPTSRKTPVPTFSAAQVREPIRPGVSHGSAPYAAHLEPHARQLDRIREKQAALLSQR